MEEGIHRINFNYSKAVEEIGSELANLILEAEYNEYIRGRGMVSRYRSPFIEDTIGEEVDEELY